MFTAAINSSSSPWLQQRYDDGRIEVVGFTMAALVRYCDPSSHSNTFSYNDNSIYTLSYIYSRIT